MGDKKHKRPSLADKLKSLGVKVGTSHLPLSKPASHPIDSVVAGSFLSTLRGEAFVAEQIFEKDYLHGKVSHLSSLRQGSGQAFPLSLISEWANEPRIS